MERTEIREGGSRGMVYSLRVLRMPALGDEHALRLEDIDLPEDLREAMRRADQEYERLVNSIPVEYYQELAVPSSIEVDRETSEKLAALLGMRRDFPGVLGPETAVLQGKAYKVWIQTLPCG